MGIYPPPKLGHLRRHDVPDESTSTSATRVMSPLPPFAAGVAHTGIHPAMAEPARAADCRDQVMISSSARPGCLPR
jgi:hypothetical protein